MKYLVNRKTKEHKLTTNTMSWGDKDWTLVQADSEGWIKHDGTECPLPDIARCDIRFNSGALVNTTRASGWVWKNATRYRPILAVPEKAQELQFTPRCIRCGGGGIAPHDPHCPNGKNLIDRLKSAHEAASEIPDLVAELRRTLKPLGLGVMYLYEFDAKEQTK
jgi:hypothetical protein